MLPDEVLVLVNPPSNISQISRVGKPPSKKRGRSERRRQFSNTMAVIREDPHDINARLKMVELLQEDQRVDDSVDELMRVASVYTRRGVPVKAVAVLRQAVRLQPDRPDVRMAYGEVFTKLRMVEDAARAYRRAYELYKAADNLSAMLDALSGVVRLDPGNLQANLRLAEALSRAGRNEQAAVIFTELASHLLELGAIEDWEKIAERAVFHTPEDSTLAHDLALHYVRDGRYGAALSKLIICYEREPNDVELLELIVDTLEYLGVRDRAAAIMRQLVHRYQRGGLVVEAEAALERLYTLDPDDPEAQVAMGALKPAVAPLTVIELEHDENLPRIAASDEDDDGEIGFGGDFIDKLLSEDATFADDVDDTPELPEDAFDDLERDDEVLEAIDDLGAADFVDDDFGDDFSDDFSDDFDDGDLDEQDDPTVLLDVISPRITGGRRQVDASQPARAKPALARPARAKPAAPRSARSRPSGPQVVSARSAPPARPQPAAPQPAAPQPAAPQPAVGRRHISPSSPARPSAAAVSPTAHRGRISKARLSGIRRRHVPQDDDATQALVPVPVRRAPRLPFKRTGDHVSVAPQQLPVHGEAAPGPSRTEMRAAARDFDSQLGDSVMASSAAAPRAASSQPRASGHLPKSRVSSSRISSTSRLVSVARSGSGRSGSGRIADSDIGFDGAGEATVFDPGLLEQLKALDANDGSAASAASAASPRSSVEAGRADAPRGLAPSRTTLTAKRRGNSLPRPRLTRARYTAHDLPAQARGVNNDLKTLDFFIERGFYESAVALVDDLAKRHSNSEELRLRRQRIAQMKR